MDGLLGVQDITKVMGKKGYAVFASDKKPFNLNIVGIRSNDDTANTFNDLITMFWKYSGHWTLLKFKATTDPGIYYRENPASVEGTAILKPMQHKGMWKLGKHKGTEPAFQQLNPCTVLRDDDGDRTLDFDTAKEETGNYGINGHKAGKQKESIYVDKWSAGCQVWANPHEHNVALCIAEQALEYWNNSFTYTLLEEKDF